MTFTRTRLLLMLAVLLVGLVGTLVLLGEGSYSEGGSFSEMLLTVKPTEPVKSVPGVDFQEDTPDRSLPPESTLSFGGQTLSSGGSVIGVWESQRLFSGEVYGPSGMNSSDGPFSLTDGSLLTAPEGSTVKFRYGGEVDVVRDFFDVLALKVEKGDLTRGSKTNRLEHHALGEPPDPIVLNARQSGMVGKRPVKIPLNLAPGVYVISVTASVTENSARYNFRVVVEEG